MSGNSLRQTVHTHCASVHQAAKLVAALLRVAGVIAGLEESNGSLPPGLWLTSPAGWLPRTGISSGTLRSVKAKFQYTDPHGPDRTRADPHGLCRRPARTQRSFSETRATKKSVRVRSGPVGSSQACIVEFSQYQTKCADFVWSGPVRSGPVRSGPCSGI